MAPAAGPPMQWAAFRPRWSGGHAREWRLRAARARRVWLVRLPGCREDPIRWRAARGPGLAAAAARAPEPARSAYAPQWVAARRVAAGERACRSVIGVAVVA